MPYLKTIILTLILSHWCIYYSDAQTHNLLQSPESNLLIRETNRLLGLDDLLVNGKRYIPANNKVTGSPEFEYNSTGVTKIYVKGQCFENAAIALDIVSDLLILTQPRGNGLDDRIILHPAFIDSFTLGDHLFINPMNFREHFTEQGYYEKIGGKSELLLKKYRKAYLKIYDSSNRGKYSPQRFSLSLLINNEYPGRGKFKESLP